MNAQLQHFSFDQDGLLADVRIHIGENGEPLFVANDVASALGYSDAPRSVRAHCKGGIEMTTNTAGGVQKLKFINEPDVYRLVMRSKLPSAEKFQDWVYNTVLPSIRKHGYFQLRDMSAPVRQVIDLQRHALDLFTKLKKETDADSREYLYSLLQSVSSLLNQPAPPITSIGKTVSTPTEHPLVAKFFDRIALLETKGYQLDHSRNQVVAINLPQFINLCAEEKLPAIPRYEWADALRTSARFIDTRTVNSVLHDRSVKCWLFTKEISA